MTVGKLAGAISRSFLTFSSFLLFGTITSSMSRRASFIAGRSENEEKNSEHVRHPELRNASSVGFSVDRAIEAGSNSSVSPRTSWTAAS
jgi:hypothetical protein